MLVGRRLYILLVLLFGRLVQNLTHTKSTKAGQGITVGAHGAIVNAPVPCPDDSVIHAIHPVTCCPYRCAGGRCAALAQKPHGSGGLPWRYHKWKSSAHS